MCIDTAIALIIYKYQLFDKDILYALTLHRTLLYPVINQPWNNDWVKYDQSKMSYYLSLYCDWYTSWAALSVKKNTMNKLDNAT